MLAKVYGDDPREERRLSPPVVFAEEIRVIEGSPECPKISTSFVERQNLTMRMSMRRFTRLTDAFSKEVANHAAAVALHFMSVNSPGRTRASTTRSREHRRWLADHIWTCEEIAALLD